MKKFSESLQIVVKERCSLPHEETSKTEEGLNRIQSNNEEMK